jgi:signal transduction histidine kinase
MSEIELYKEADAKRLDEIQLLRQQLQQQEKLASLGLLSAGIAHEIKNPLNFVINFSKISSGLLEDLSAIVASKADLLPKNDREDIIEIVSNLKDELGQIKESGERAIDIIEGILLVSRGKEDEFMLSDVCHIVKEFVHLSYHAMRANHRDFNVTIREHYQEDMPMMMVIPQDLSRAVLNVMNNACYAVWRQSQKLGNKAGYKPCIEVTVAFDHDLTISVADNGEGMTEEVKQRLFENFFTTKPVGEGTGLGLSITRNIIENKHGGKITFTSTEGKGSTFTFTIPNRK